MDRKVVISLLLSILPILVCAQASGGQIRRQSESSSQNIHDKPTKPSSSNRDIVKISEPDGSINGHGYVDLDLPSRTKWATCNVGANIPEDYGYYFAWGETEQKNEYWPSETSLYGVVIDDISNNIYDVAKIKWGDSWSIPTKYQWDELIRCCKLKVTKKNGINGILFIGKNGRSVFFPIGGRKIYSILQFEGSDGHYWSSNADYKYQGDPAYAPNGYSTSYLISITSAGIAFSEPEWRGFGLNIRPVTN